MGRLESGFGCPVTEQSGTGGSGPGARQQQTHLPTSPGAEGDLEAKLPVRGTRGFPRTWNTSGVAGGDEGWAGQKWSVVLAEGEKRQSTCQPDLLEIRTS